MANGNEPGWLCRSRPSARCTACRKSIPYPTVRQPVLRQCAEASGNRGLVPLSGELSLPSAGQGHERVLRTLELDGDRSDVVVELDCGLVGTGERLPVAVGAPVGLQQLRIGGERQVL